MTDSPFVTTAEAVFVAVRYGMPEPTVLEAPTDALPTRLRVHWGDQFDQWADYLNAEVTITESADGTAFATAVGTITDDMRVLVSAWHIPDPGAVTAEGLATAEEEDPDAS